MLRSIIVAAGGCIAFIVYASICSIAGRPVLTSDETYLSLFVERFSAFAVLGSLLALALPGQMRLAGAMVVGFAVLLEVFQCVIPGRDPGLVDVLQKMAGGMTGLLLANAIVSRLPAASR